MSDQEVNWSLLPDRAEEFFGLPQGFELRDLKRAYNRKIKVFKPEKYPEEFKKIRSAFENLERQLRYKHEDESFSIPSGLTELSNRDEQPQELDRPHTSHDSNWLEQWNEKLDAKRPLGELQSWLINEPQVPPSFVESMRPFLQVMNDEGESLITVLLKDETTVKKSAKQCQLLALLCQGELSQADMMLLIEKLANIYNSEDYFFYTEALWIKLSRTLSIHELIDCYEKYTNKFKLDTNISQAVFLSRFLKTVCLKADPEWLQQKYEMILDAFGYEDFYYTEDLDQIELLLKLRAQYEQGEIQSKGTTKVYEVIKQYFECDIIEGEKCVLKFATQIQDRGELFNHFKFEEKTNFILLETFDMVLRSIYDNEETDFEFTEQDQFNWVGSLLMKIQKISDDQVWNFVRNFILLVSLVFLVVLNLYIDASILRNLHSMFDTLEKGSVLDWVCSLGLCGLLGFVSVKFIAFPFLRQFDKVTKFIVRRQYLPEWQDAVLDFFKQHPVTSSELLAILNYIDQQEVARYSDDLIYALNMDQASLYYGLVQRVG